MKNLQETLVNKVNASKAQVQDKYFKQFVAAKDAKERDVIGDKMNVLDSVIFDLIKELRKTIT